MSDADRELVDAVVTAEHDGMRADRYVSEVLELFPRSQLKTRAAEIRINGRPAKLSRSVHEGDYIEVAFGTLPLPDLEPEPIPLSIIFENADVLVVDKPQGMVVHPAQGNYSGTLANAVLHHTGRLSAGSEAPDLRPGIVHRLDKDTSGVIVVAKTAAAHDALASQFHDRKVEKRYIALTKGIPSPMRGQVEGFIRRDPHNRKRFTHHESEGKQACTEYSVLRAFGDHAVVALFPRTGRTHQLRVHMRHLGCPILGDPVYARRSTGFPEATLMLHALSLNLRLPGDRAPRTFVAKLPHRFAEVIGMLAGFPQT